ncbi:FAD dependent oxidoreductase [Mollisia scopiformis]|uniref:FAD dependent oxidoreductase n=1 Tax=Mollisia scopiformis TaxID=149040 RepID=A0A194XHN9_MOLSC|nr:FAD dependent oxidoreductase [Mollisia scopiformis]KUJ19730.1 FAD dependent oxidoreductase [Mollisia scopiformis]
MGSNEPVSKPFPSKESITPFWRTELHELDDHRTTEELPESCDILIIGAGYAGITAAYHLLCNEETAPSAKPSVVLLEARQACSGATGRNGGHLRPSVYSRLTKWIKKYGLEAAEELAKFEFDHIRAVADVVKKEKIDCDFKLSRSFDIHTEPEVAAAAKKDYLELKKAGIAKTTIDDIVFTDGDDAEQVSGVKGCVACVETSAGQVWPYKLMMGLLSRAVSQGLNLQTHTPCTSITPSPITAGKWIATTPRGTITASKTIIATNGYTSALLPEYSTKIYPAKGICCRIVCPPSFTPPKLSSTYVLRLGNGSGDYLIQREDGSIIVGGARPNYISNTSSWLSNTDDSTLIPNAASYFDTYMQDNFAGWEESGAYVERIWTGIMGYNADENPSVGEVPGRDGMFVAAGFEGHGMPVIFLTMKGVAEMVGRGKRFEETGIPRMYKTTRERLESDYNVLVRGEGK